MPRLLLFAPCERVILGQGDNSASLIVVIQEMQFHGVLKKGEELPKDAAAVARFVIFSQWHKSVEDEGKTFEQRIVLSIQNEEPILESVAEFRMTDRLHRMMANVPMLPFIKQGEYSLKLFVREKGERDWGKALADYPITVSHVLQFQPQP